MYAFLVGATVFKTGETESLGLAGSIPVHLRHRPDSDAGAGVGAEDDRVLPHAWHSAGGAGAVTAARDMLIKPRDRQSQES